MTHVFIEGKGGKYQAVYSSKRGPFADAQQKRSDVLREGGIIRKGAHKFRMGGMHVIQQCRFSPFPQRMRQQK